MSKLHPESLREIVQAVQLFARRASYLSGLVQTHSNLTESPRDRAGLNRLALVLRETAAALTSPMPE